MTRITVDVNEEWLNAAGGVLGTDTPVATINAALRTFALRREATDIMTAFDSVSMDYSRSGEAWRYGGGRDLASLAEDARMASAEQGSL